MRYRQRGLFLDSAQLLTRGPMQVPTGALLSYIAPATGIFTYLCSKDGSGPPLLGQATHNWGAQYARLTFLAPEAALDSAALAVLIEHLIARVGERGALRVLAEVDECSMAFEALRRISFAIYARQRLWRLTGKPAVAACPTSWQESCGRDGLAIRSLYGNLVPGMVQQAESLNGENMHGMVFRHKDDLLGYAEIKTGPRGIWIQPFLHPDVEEAACRLASLVENLPNRRSRPVYLCIRSYQSWLESAVTDLGADPGPLQAVMVKHLAVPIKAARAFTLRRIEGKQPEVTTPFARSENKTQL